MNRKTKIALIQMAMDSNPESNIKKALDKIAAAAERGAEVVCLPELFKSLYFCQKEETAFFDLAEPIPGPSTAALGGLAKKLGIVIIASLFERRASGLYHNTAAVIDHDGSLAGVYRKMHIPDDPSYYEKYYFTPGDLGYRAVETSAGKIGILVCWDQWYPEAARLTAMQGAQVLFYPTAIGWHPHEKTQYGAAQRDAWRTIQRSHAIANGVYVAAVNRIGHERLDAASPGIEFFGSSFIASPFGEIAAEASTDKEETIIHEIDPARCEEIRRNWPFLRDRRIDSYGDITRRFIDPVPGEK